MRAQHPPKFPANPAHTSNTPQQRQRRGAREPATKWLGLFVRGLAMGVVEVVPGVSAGTIAFVTGIYREFVGSLASFTPRSITWCITDFGRFWRHHNLPFLACLGSGMAIGLVAFANLMNHWLQTAPVVVWAFFFGLILFSALDIGRARKPSKLATFGLIGALCGWLITKVSPLATDLGLAAYFLGGALAIGAWLLPAVSGGLVLLLLGLYEDVLAALVHWDLALLAVLASGCLAGLALFSRLVRMLMLRRFETMMSFLTGLLAGSLMRLWPWQHEGALLSPAAFTEQTAAPANLALALTALLAGSATLWLLTRLRT